MIKNYINSDKFYYINSIIVLAIVVEAIKIYSVYNAKLITLIPIILIFIGYIIGITLTKYETEISFYIKLIVSTILLFFLILPLDSIISDLYVSYSSKIIEYVIILILFIANYVSLIIENKHFKYNPFSIYKIDNQGDAVVLIILSIVLSVGYFYYFLYLVFILTFSV